ncbi:ankyrin repeat-containing domain protein [Aspergillus insuetus]
MSLQTLPVELLVDIIASLASLQSLHALALTSRAFYALTDHALYEQDAQGPKIAIQWAATHGDIDLLNKSLDHGAQVLPVARAPRPERVNPQQPNTPPGSPHPLCLAVEHGHVEIVDSLLDLDCHSLMTNEQKLWVLVSAVTGGHAAVVRLLLRRKGVQQDKGWYIPEPWPIQIAAHQGNQEMVEILLADSSNRPGELQMKRALECALLGDHLHLVPLLLLLDKEDPNRCYGLDFSFHTSGHSPLDTPLCWAAGTGHLAFAQLFLDKGADPDYPRGWNTPPLLVAVQGRHQEMVRLLTPVTHRIHVTRALALSMEQADGTIAKILLENGAKPGYESNDSSVLNSHYGGECMLGMEDELVPPLIAAVGRGNETLVRLLVEHGADVNVSYHRGLGSKEKNVPDGFMGAPLLLAMELGFEEIAAFLRENGGREEAGTWEEQFEKRFPQDVIDMFMSWGYKRPGPG